MESLKKGDLVAIAECYIDRIDRTLVELKRSGKLSNTEVMVLGGMKDFLLPFGESTCEIIAHQGKEFGVSCGV